jgi:hypothetical protein
MNEVQGYRGQIDQAVDVIAAAPRVWVIATGEYDEQMPVAVVHGTEADAERYVEQYNATHPWRDEYDKAHVWCDVEFIGPAVQG